MSYLSSFIFILKLVFNAKYAYTVGYHKIVVVSNLPKYGLDLCHICHLVYSTNKVKTNGDIAVVRYFN